MILTAYVATRNRQPAAGAGAAAIIWWGAVSLKRAWSRYRTRLILTDLDDHVLRDIGLNPLDMRPQPMSLKLLSVRAESRMMSPIYFGR
jgi:uncharacterized protein YjiS (DUF1127 family)